MSELRPAISQPSFSSGWETVCIGKLAIRVGSGATPFGGSDVYTESGVTFIRSQNVKNSGLSLEDVAFIDQNTHERMMASAVEPADVLLNITGASIGRCCFLPDGIGPANVNQHVCAIRLPKPDFDDAKFLASVLTSHIGQSQIARFNAGGNREGLNYKQLRSFKVPWPPKSTRIAIAEILTAIDEAILQTEALIEKSQRLKEGLMHDLLTRGVTPDGHLRPTYAQAPHLYQSSPLGWIPKDWSCDRLENLTLKIVDGVHSTPTYASHGVPFVTVKNLTSSDGIEFKNINYVAERDHREFIKRADPRTGDVLVTKDGTLGVARLVESGHPEFSIFVSVALLRPMSQRVIPETVRAFFASGSYERQLGGLSAGSGLKHIHLEHFRRFLLPLPPLREQEEIATVTASINERLKAERLTLANFRQQKQGLMHDLLTGRVRVTA